MQCARSPISDEILAVLMQELSKLAIVTVHRAAFLVQARGPTRLCPFDPVAHHRHTLNKAFV